MPAEIEEPFEIFEDELDKLIGYFIDEYDICYHDVIGVLERAKLYYNQQAIEACSDEEDY